jgi:ankyrin repeat protein
MSGFKNCIVILLILSTCSLGGKEKTEEARLWELDFIQAVVDDDLDLMQALLVEPLGDVDALDDKGCSALYNAIKKDVSTDVIYALLNAERNLEKSMGEQLVNKPTNDNSREYPLNLAARNAAADVVSKLIKCGARLLVQNSDGDTPLHFAVRYNKTDNITVLENAGQDKGLLERLLAHKNKKGKSPKDEKDEKAKKMAVLVSHDATMD